MEEGTPAETAVEPVAKLVAEPDAEPVGGTALEELLGAKPFAAEEDAAAALAVEAAGDAAEVIVQEGPPADGDEEAVADPGEPAVCAGPRCD